MAPAFNVLFLCTRNSARSIMAEALLEKIGKGRFNAYSAGSDPATAPMPEVIERLKQLGHDVSKLRCKSWNEFTGPMRRAWISSSRSATRRRARTAPTSARSSSPRAWPLPDPAEFTGSAAERATLLNELYAHGPPAASRSSPACRSPSLDRMALKKRLDEIGDTVRTAP